MRPFNSFCVLKLILMPTNFVLIRNISKQTCICVKTSSFDSQTLEKTLAQFSPFLLDFTSPELVIRGGWSNLGTYLLASEIIYAMVNSCSRVFVGCSMVEFR